MHRSCVWLVVLLLVSAATKAQNAPPSDPQALNLAVQSVTAMTGGSVIADVTLTGTVTWNGADTGNVTLTALGVNESRVDMALTTGTRTEIRDSQTGTPVGQWFAPGNTSGYIAFQNCWTDAVWFFPILGSLAAGPNVVLTYIGQETHNGQSVQHLQSSLYPSGQFPSPTPQQLSIMDFYIDSSTFLPEAIVFNVHPDADANTNLLVEVDFSNYQTVNGISVPMRIQKFLQGSLIVDIAVSGAAFNTGVPLSTFTIN